MTPSDDSSRLDTVEFWTQLAALEDGSMPPEEKNALMEKLEKSAAARRLYAEYFLHSEGLAAEARYLEERGCLPVLNPHANPSRLFVRSLLVAAALIVISAVIASLVMLKRPDVPLLSAASTANAKWTINGESQNPEDDDLTVAAGSTVDVMSGTLRLNFDSGSSMVLQGPARVAFPTLEKPVIDHGWLWIDSGESGQSFEVETPDLLVRDIGTRFGVRVPSQGPAEVHLISGKVEVLSRETRKIITSLESQEHGHLIADLDDPVRIPLARDPFPDLEKLLSKKANYATTIRSQNPTGYWQMDHLDTNRLTNAISRGVMGGRHSSSLISKDGPSAATGFTGFAENNHAITLPGDPRSIPLSLGVNPVHQGLLFEETFSGNEDSLNGSSPTVSTLNQKWISSPLFRKNGTIIGDTGSATLGFVPLDGCRYTLDASFRDLQGNDDWIAFGFANGQSTVIDYNNRFISGNPEGRAWTITRGNNDNFPNQAFTRGIGDPFPWSFNHDGNLDLRITLDTTEGAGNWTTTWFAKLPLDSDYHCIRPKGPLVTEMIGSIGLAVSGSEVSAKITHFSLRADGSSAQKSRRHLARGPARLPRREGAVSFWLRCPEKATQREILWAAGEDPSDHSMRASLEADGGIAFFMENGRYDILITSRPKIDDGRWHHLAITWSPASVDLYLDGKRVARDSEGRSIQQGILTELRFGCGPNGSTNAPFKGQLDEIAVWDRPLTAVEVHHQFQSAAGP